MLQIDSKASKPTKWFNFVSCVSGRQAGRGGTVEVPLIIPFLASRSEPLKNKMTNRTQKKEQKNSHPAICWLIVGIVLHVCLYGTLFTRSSLHAGVGYLLLIYLKVNPKLSFLGLTHWKVARKSFASVFNLFFLLGTIKDSFKVSAGTDKCFKFLR